MKISSTQTGWILASIIMLGFLIPWVRYAPKQSSQDADLVAQRLADEKSEFWYDYVLMNWYDWQTLWGNPAAGASGYQIALLDKDANGEASEAAVFAKILFGSKAAGIKGKVLLLAPILGLLGAVALMGWQRRRQFVLVMIGLELLFYVFVRWELYDTFLDRLLVLEMNWGIWLTLYGLLLLALVQAVRLVMSPKVKW